MCGYYTELGGANEVIGNIEIDANHSTNPQVKFMPKSLSLLFSIGYTSSSFRRYAFVIGVTIGVTLVGFGNSSAQFLTDPLKTRLFAVEGHFPVRHR